MILRRAILFAVLSSALSGCYPVQVGLAAADLFSGPLSRIADALLEDEDGPGELEK